MNVTWFTVDPFFFFFYLYPTDTESNILRRSWLFGERAIILRRCLSRKSAVLRVRACVISIRCPSLLSSPQGGEWIPHAFKCHICSSAAMSHIIQSACERACVIFKYACAAPGGLPASSSPNRDVPFHVRENSLYVKKSPPEESAQNVRWALRP